MTTFTRPEGTLVFLIAPRRELVMMHRDKEGSHCWPDYWGVLGGKPEVGETALETALREVREEAGLDLTELHEIDVVFAEEPYEILPGTQEVSKRPPHVFWKLWSGTADNLVKGDEGQALGVIPVDDVVNMKVPPYILVYLEQVLARFEEVTA
ncbi:NUDIX domain-containing protein [Streptomyces sp. NPDC056144]|uniref:NUDIX domain-containing protein n=1 Tax=unclassified Streptomyces TaxID=2593676 RepID=UPI0035DC4DDA